MWIAVFFYRSFFIMIRHQPKQLRKSSLDYHRFAACLIPPQKTEIILWPLSKYVVHLAELWAKAMLSIHVQSNIFKHVPWKKRIPLVSSLDFSSPPQKKEVNSLKLTVSPESRPSPTRKWSSSNHQIIRCELLLSGSFRYTSQTWIKGFSLVCGAPPLLIAQGGTPLIHAMTTTLTIWKVRKLKLPIRGNSLIKPPFRGDLVWCRYNCMITVFCFPTFSPLKLPRDLKLTCLAATSTLWITEMFSQNLEKDTAFLNHGKQMYTYL